MLVGGRAAHVLLGRWQLDVWHDHRSRQRRVGHPARRRCRSTTCSGRTRRPRRRGSAARSWSQGAGTPADTVYVADRERDGPDRGLGGDAGRHRLGLGDPGRPWLDCRAPTTRRPRRPAAPPWSGCSSRRRTPVSPTTTPPTTSCPELSTTDLLPRRAVRPLRRVRRRHRPRRARGAARPSTGMAGWRRGHARSPARRRTPSSGAAQPALRVPVVGLRRVRDLHVVAVAAGGRARAARMGLTPAAGRFGSVSKLFPAYRVLAILVGVLLAFCSLVVLPARYSRRRRLEPPAVRRDLEHPVGGPRLGLHRLRRGLVPAVAADPLVGSRSPPGAGLRPDPAGDLLGRARRHPPDPRRAPRAAPHRR